MKNFKSALIGILILSITLSVHAQTSSLDYFAGSWSILLKNTPNGDVRMIFKLDKMSDSLSGVVLDSTGKEISKISKIERNDSAITAYFSAEGYDVNIALTRKDEDHITGSLMGMFDAEGERIKAIKKEK
jgi:hypothetical protein